MTKGIYSKIVFYLLGQMSAGKLIMELPDGSQKTFGKGDEMVCRMKINTNAFFRRCVLFGDIGFGESFMLGEWESDDVTAVIKWLILNIDKSPVMSGRTNKFSPVNFLKAVNTLYHKARPNSISGSKKNISEHYDLGNDFYRAWLDKSLTYSSGIFREDNTNLEDAQYEKYDRLCRELKIKSDDHILEIGSGWGGFACHAAANYGCKVTTVTISEAQFKFAKDRFEREGLSDKVNIYLKDYRKIEGKFDKIVSIEMLEAVGHKYLPMYFAKCHELLKPKGLLGLQVIICPDSRYDELRQGVDWIQKHIFPGSLLPSVRAINLAINETGDLSMIGLKELGKSYARTLNLWRENFNNNLEEIKKLGYSDQFIRKWNYYLSYCEAAFDMRNINVVQMVYSRPNNLSL